MPRYPAQKSTQTKAPKTNEKGEIVSWDSNSPDGRYLRVLINEGIITTETAVTVKKEHPRFRQYANRTLNSALSNARKSMAKEVDVRMARGSSAVNTHSNLNINLGTIQEDGSYHSSQDSNYNYEEDLTDAVSQLSMDDHYSYDTVTTAFNSQQPHAGRVKHEQDGMMNDMVVGGGKKKKTIYGNTKIGLPYILDLWRDCMSHGRVSIQLQLLSGTDAYKKVFLRVSTSGTELVVTLPMSPYLSRSDFAFNTFLLREGNVAEQDKAFMKVLLKHHPKATARMVSVSKIKGRSNTDGFFYEQRIRLPRKCNHTLASATDGDELFQGKKFIQYPDGSIFLHVELVVESNDNYVPEERMLDPSVMKTAGGNPSTVDDHGGVAPMETEASSGVARELETSSNDNNVAPAPKRTRVEVETMGEDEDDDEYTYFEEEVFEEEQSTTTGAGAGAMAVAAAAAAAESEALNQASVEHAHQNGASVLHEQTQLPMTSLQAAAMNGKRA